jgi:signal transduction histidine kinase
MLRFVYRFIDWFIPPALRASESERPMARFSVALHITAPVFGQLITLCLGRSAAGHTWQFCVIEGLVVSFLVMPFLLRRGLSLRMVSTISLQGLVSLSLFGSFFLGGVASPLLPWFLIAMVLAFFFLADFMTVTLTGTAIQLAIFIGARLAYGRFPTLLDPHGLAAVNALSILMALLYMTVCTLLFEKVMRINLSLEQAMIDQRVKLARTREAMEAAELASTRKSIFLAKISHELRTPLNAVIGYAEMLRENFEDMPGAARKMEDLERIHAAGRHLLALVNNVIDLSSIESNREELTLEPIDVTALVDEVVATASPLMAKRDNRMVVYMPVDLGTLDLDALKVRQCMLNLLSNAAKFTTKGMIMLTVLRRDQDGSAHMVVEVTDNGIGMTQHGLGRIFKNFTQAENDTVSHFGGTGLGLALTRRFCEMMGGGISVRSERGVGTSFTMNIPITSSPQAFDGQAGTRTEGTAA